MDIQTQMLVSARKNRTSTASLSASPSKSRSISQSIATVEELLFEAEARGNTRKANALRLILKRFRKMADSPYLLQ